MLKINSPSLAKPPAGYHVKISHQYRCRLCFQLFGNIVRVLRLRSFQFREFCVSRFTLTWRAHAHHRNPLSTLKNNRIGEQTSHCTTINTSSHQPISHFERLFISLRVHQHTAYVAHPA